MALHYSFVTANSEARGAGVAAMITRPSLETSGTWLIRDGLFNQASSRPRGTCEGWG